MIVLKQIYTKDYVLSKQGEPQKNFRLIFEVTVTQSNIDFEREQSAAEDRKEGIPVRYFSDEYLETLAVYRKIAEQMLSYNTICFIVEMVFDEELHAVDWILRYGNPALARLN